MAGIGANIASSRGSRNDRRIAGNLDDIGYSGERRTAIIVDLVV